VQRIDMGAGERLVRPDGGRGELSRTGVQVHSVALERPQRVLVCHCRRRKDVARSVLSRVYGGCGG